MTVKREINESPMAQGINEIVIYTLDTSPWGGSPSNVAVSVFDYTERIMDGNSNVTEDVMPVNTPTVDGDTIALSPLHNLDENIRYRINILWTFSGNTFDTYCYIDTEK